VYLQEDRFLALAIPLPPPLPEQRRIVAELDALLPAVLDQAFRGEL
jgi:restriction endonuclease S subunit